MIVRELLTKLAFDADESKVKSFDNAVGNLVKGLTALVGAATAATTAAFALATQTAKYGDEVAKTSRTLGLGVRELQQYRFAFDRVGIGQEEVTNGLERLSRNLGQAATGSEASRKGFDALGISIYNTDGSLRQIRDVMPEIIEGLSNTEGEAQSAAIAADLFGRSGIRLGRALRQGKGELDDLIQQFEMLGGGMSEAQAIASEEFMDAMTNMNVVLQNLRLQIGARLMPIFQDFVEMFTDFLIVNRELIMARVHRAFEILIGVVRTATRVLRTIWDAASRVAEVFGGWENTIRGVGIAIGLLMGYRVAAFIWGIVGAIAAAGGAMTVLRAAMMRIPFFAVMAGLVLLVDELWNWAQGNDTVIEHVLGSWEDFVGDWNALLTDVFEGNWMSALDRMGDAALDFTNRVMGYLKELLLPQWLIDFMDEGGAIGAIGRIREGTAGVAESEQFPPTDDLSGIAAQQITEGSSGRTVIVNDNRQTDITVPPGTTQEQIDAIQRQFDRSMNQQINDAALNLETR